MTIEKHYVNSNGIYLGAFYGANPPEGSIQVNAPPDAFYKWVNNKWVRDYTNLRNDMELSFAQLLIGLEKESWITTEEARNWLMGISLPAQVVTYINMLPASTRFAVEAKAMRASVILRLDPIVLAMQQLVGKSDADMDNFFITYAGY